MIKKTLLLFLLLLIPQITLAKSFTFYVKMACGNCSQAITSMMEKKHSGQYTNLVADFEKDVVTLDSDTLTEKQIVKAIEKAGFTVSETPIASTK
ncbi:MAG: hypothetical protein KDD46_03490 [Bdellovibrionales bacterium]|nr:hypothetical protein [Bdellovibrionales bacterium]